jgi:hypothetical protein
VLPKIFLVYSVGNCGTTNEEVKSSMAESGRRLIIINIVAWFTVCAA